MPLMARGHHEHYHSMFLESDIYWMLDWEAADRGVRVVTKRRLLHESQSPPPPSPDLRPAESPPRSLSRSFFFFKGKLGGNGRVPIVSDGD